ncbi:MAG: hypothetical protein JEZ06_22995 [Anaerolineaceae bacterium]|nr:hypothetical protein [Anaerolineaceae bacterium]
MTKRYFSTFQLFLLTFFSVLVVVAKIALRLPLQLSGHSGIFWMTIVIVGSKVVPKKGAASVIGLLSGLIAAFMGLGDLGALNTLLSYAVLGICTDLALMFLGDPENMIVAGMAAAFGHLSKLLVKWLFSIIAGAPVGFIALGLAKAIGLYIVFGALGGILGSLTLKALRKAGYFDYLAEKR